MATFLSDAVDVFLHVDQHLNEWAGALGPWLYVVLFLILFFETGIVVTPFLPGDSLLFAVGALSARPGSPIDLTVTALLLSAAAVLGDAANYAIGRSVGPRVFRSETSRWLSRRHLLRAQGFYERHGGKTIVLARFVPILRTFAPFVAGIGQMPYRTFVTYNVAGAVLWVGSCLFAGYFFGNLPVVRDNFGLVVVAIVLLSLVPAALEFLRHRRAAARAKRVVDLRPRRKGSEI